MPYPIKNSCTGRYSCFFLLKGQEQSLRLDARRLIDFHQAAVELGEQLVIIFLQLRFRRLKLIVDQFHIVRFNDPEPHPTGVEHKITGPDLLANKIILRAATQVEFLH